MDIPVSDEKNLEFTKLDHTIICAPVTTAQLDGLEATVYLSHIWKLEA